MTSSENILILGASSDLGRGIIRDLSNAGTTILAHYRTSADKFVGLGQNIISLQADFSSEKDTGNLISRIKNEGLVPDKIIHLPAPPVENIRFKDLSWNHFQANLDIQLRSVAMILKEFLPLMAKGKKGKVLFILSSYTLGVPPKFLSHYVTTKYALLGLMKSLASEYADKYININAISPSMVETNFLEKVPKLIIEMNAEQHPLKRNATPQDIIPLVRFLLSPDSNYITGVNIPVSGGLVF